MELVSRSESGLEPEWAAGDREERIAGASSSTSGLGSAYVASTGAASGSGSGETRIRNASSSSASIPGPSTPLQRPVTPPPMNDANLLGVGSRWAGGDDGGDGHGNARSSRLFGRSPPPPPGPPPSDPPPLPPASSHPFASVASSSSSSRPKPSARLSSLSSLRKANLTSSRPSSPAGPPPTGDLPPLPVRTTSHPGHSPNPYTSSIEGAPSVSGSSNEGGRPGHSRKVSDTPPQVSPRSSSLAMSQQAGLSNTGAATLATPIVLSGKQTQSRSSNPESSSSSSSRSHPQPTAPTISAPAPSAGESPRITHSHSHLHAPKPPRTPSRHLLQTALDLAQRAVEMDKNNDVAGALAAYREAVNRLKAVMERVGVEPTGNRRRRSGTGKSEEEGRTLRGIHDAYVARIQLLSSYEHKLQPTNPVTSTSTLVPPSHSQNSLSDEGTPRPSLDDGGMTGIGNLMLSDPGDQSFDTSMSPPRKQALNSTGTSTEGESDTQAGTAPHDMVPQIAGRLGQTGSSSPNIPLPNGNAPGGEMSLQQALDRAAEASATNADRASLRMIPSGPNRGSGLNASIGLGYPTSPPSHMVQSVSSSTPQSKPQTLPPSRSEDGHGSPSSSKLRLKRPVRPSLGLEMETDLSGIDGVDEAMEVLARTPRESYMPASLVTENGPRSDPRQLGRTASREPDSPHSVTSTSDDHRPLPPLPDSAPSLDAGTGQPAIKTRKASLSGASVPLGRTSSNGSVNDIKTFLVSPTTSQGTISQRRQSRPISGNMSAALEQMRSQQNNDHHQQQHQHQRSSTQIPIQTRDSTSFPPGDRPSIHGGDLPPVPSATLRHKSSFSSSSQLGNGIIPQIQRQSVSPNLVTDGRVASSSAGLRINTDHSHGGGASGLAPPINIASKAGSPRSLPLLPDTAVGSVLSIGAGSLISPLPEFQPMEIIHRPFHLLRIIHASMDPESSGSYLTGAIHISSAVWNPTNWSKSSSFGGQNHSGQGVNGKIIAPPKILAQDTKVRCIEALILHFEAVRITGQALLSGPRDKIRTGAGASEGGKIAEEFCVALDELDEEMDSTHKALVKQGVGVGGWKGKKTGGSTKSWGSRISRSMDKMTNSKNDRLDSTDKYVDLLAHLCGGAQIISDHLLNYTSGRCTTSYAFLPEKGHRNIEARLRRTSEFVGAVIVPFVLDDFKQFFLRYLKGGVRYLED
ncbi:hypothetical protein I317_05938 [Kwoniella heveanensis CBS 569]|nr:hypothetical protein I317_05938 [Kwoniella heveanensis CBS 569]